MTGERRFWAWLVISSLVMGVITTYCVGWGGVIWPGLPIRKHVNLPVRPAEYAQRIAALAKTNVEFYGSSTGWGAAAYVVEVALRIGYRGKDIPGALVTVAANTPGLVGVPTRKQWFKEVPPDPMEHYVAWAELEAGWPLHAMRGSFYRTEGGEEGARGGMTIAGKQPSKLTFAARALWLPLAPLWPGFAVNLLIYSATWMLVLTGSRWHGIRRYRWLRRGRCGHCGYDLRGGTGQCPECGKT